MRNKHADNILQIGQQIVSFFDRPRAFSRA